MKMDNDARPLIMHVVYRFYAGGLENGMVNILNQMPTDKVRHIIVCLTDHDDFIERIKVPVEVVDLHKKPGMDWSCYWRFMQLVKRHQPDIVHSRNLAALEYQLPAWCATRPLACHGEHGWDVTDLTGGSLKYRFIRWLYSHWVDAYIALSKHTLDYLIQGVGIGRHKISHICNGVDTERFQPAAKHLILPEELVDKDCFVIGTVGRLALVKNQLLLLRAFSSLLDNPASDGKKVRLLIIGSGECEEMLKAFVAEHHLTQFVIFLGQQDDINKWLHCMDLFVLPSLGEGICNTILEAMAAGKTVVATDVGGNAELVVDGKTGTLVESDNDADLERAMLNYLLRPTLLLKHAEAARLRVEHEFSLSAMVAKYTRFYHDLLAQHHHPKSLPCVAPPREVKSSKSRS
ncbi:MULTISPECIES: TIGR03088 family PEP-CTERM/XrtA system glycosyltransferase [unclassified Motilimonas]|uniref:TIGR03088 family PEP-CTERM/XrtA system glycosyltransferase n=1 Tax=unclassified Motilimonas TaxID=2643697 RepID=UPI001E348874|nr:MULTISPECIES: TIGR03088 family PEP-CTERM/XrtA system glycosyltransferase [unclassified Motilimonas]MCE0556612.1 TIGR03088 family PEP-CTERM/XrtA system glycosyltransferase [Motilimonas sp. E26]MDO6524821.1 TIGR03088 family PEP-CTERM/XrtA system glycosyltransferase [Motilimonas sp. 1_MG-2023]